MFSVILRLGEVHFSYIVKRSKIENSWVGFGFLGGEGGVPMFGAGRIF